MSDPTPPSYYPVFLDLRGKRCVVVGGGAVARRKAEGLWQAGARVTVIAPRAVAMPEGTEIVPRVFHPGDLDGAALVIAATDDAAVNAQVAAEAEARNIWVNVVDDPAHCALILPAVVRRGAFQLAISTGGASPLLARHIRHALEKAYGPEYGELVQLLWRLRNTWEPRAIAAGLTGAERRQRWEAVLQLPLLDAIRAGAIGHAEEMAREALGIWDN